MNDLIPDIATGIAIVLGALATFIVAIGSFVMQVVTYRKNYDRDVRLEQVHDLVNGQTEALKVAIGETAFGAGREAGIKVEREDPHANDPPPKPPPKPLIPTKLRKKEGG